MKINKLLTSIIIALPYVNAEQMPDKLSSDVLNTNNNGVMQKMYNPVMDNTNNNQPIVLNNQNVDNITTPERVNIPLDTSNDIPKPNTQSIDSQQDVLKHTNEDKTTETLLSKVEKEKLIENALNKISLEKWESFGESQKHLHNIAKSDVIKEIFPNEQNMTVNAFIKRINGMKPEDVKNVAIQNIANNKSSRIGGALNFITNINPVTAKNLILKIVTNDSNDKINVDGLIECIKNDKGLYELITQISLPVIHVGNGVLDIKPLVIELLSLKNYDADSIKMACKKAILNAPIINIPPKEDDNKIPVINNNKPQSSIQTGTASGIQNSSTNTVEYSNVKNLLDALQNKLSLSEKQIQYLIPHKANQNAQDIIKSLKQQDIKKIASIDDLVILMSEVFHKYNNNKLKTQANVEKVKKVLKFMNINKQIRNDDKIINVILCHSMIDNKISDDIINTGMDASAKKKIFDLDRIANKRDITVGQLFMFLSEILDNKTEYYKKLKQIEKKPEDKNDTQDNTNKPEEDNKENNPTEDKLKTLLNNIPVNSIPVQPNTNENGNAPINTNTQNTIPTQPSINDTSDDNNQDEFPVNNDKQNFIPVPQNVNESGNDNEQETDNNIPVQQNINLQKDDLPLQKFVQVQPDIVMPDENNDMVNNMNKFNQPINPNTMNIPIIPNKINIDPNQVSTPFNMNDTMNKPILQNTIGQNEINTPIITEPAFVNNTINKPILQTEDSNSMFTNNVFNTPKLPNNPSVINNTVGQTAFPNDNTVNHIVPDTVNKPLLSKVSNVQNVIDKPELLGKINNQNIQNTITDDNDVVKDGGFLSCLKSLKPKLKEIVKPVSGLFSDVKNKVSNKFSSLFAKN